MALDASPQEVFAAWATYRFVAPEAELIEVPRADLSGVCHRFAAHAAGDLNPLPLPGIAPTRDAVLRTDATFTLLLKACDAPSASFPTLDLVFRGSFRHLGVTLERQGGLDETAPEARP